MLAEPLIMDNEYESHSILGMRLDYVDAEKFMDDFIGHCIDGRSGYACSTDVHQCIRVHDDAEFRETVVNSADYVITDSFYLNHARSLLYNIKPTHLLRAAIIMPELCRRAEKTGVPIALIGGKDQEVLDKLERNLREKFPALKIAFMYSPPFRAMTEEEDATLTKEINDSGARLVFVGLGCPKQERWMAAHKGRVNAMMIGVGAAFDFNAGVVKPSPAWVHKLGLEWLYRVSKEPRRLWKRYASTAPRFLWLVFLDKLSGGKRSHS
jgi:N-acetylglucosaminyldiphosphoundecaprenol N-acetyl-beta-D-mannosaminyltransferase